MLDYLADTQAYKRDKRCAAWLFPHFTGRELTTLTVEDIYAYQRQRREAHVKDATIRRKLSLLSGALNHARQ